MVDEKTEGTGESGMGIGEPNVLLAAIANTIQKVDTGDETGELEQEAIEVLQNEGLRVAAEPFFDSSAVRGQFGLIVSLEKEMGRLGGISQTLLRLPEEDFEREDVQRAWRTIHERVRALTVLRRLVERVHRKNVTTLVGIYNSPEALLQPRPIQAYVMSVDIRRSTNLMLQANSATRFSQFLTELAEGLAKIVQDNDGVADKFTGDGLLAYFPLELSGVSTSRKGSLKEMLASRAGGNDATRTGTSVMRAAAACHRHFSTLYEAHAGNFALLNLDVGLGIGIDFGEIQTVAISSNPTIIGKPVVHACRFASAPANETWLNMGAWNWMKDSVSLYPHFTKLKHEDGKSRVWSVNPPKATREKDEDPA